MIAVALFTGTRADLGPLVPVIDALARADDLALTLLTGLGHSAGSLREQLAAAGVPGRYEIVEVAPPLSATDRPALARAGAELAGRVAAFLSAPDGASRRPEVLVVLGDRWELMYVVPAAVLLEVPVVHLHGGEVTEGALDDRVRHAVTKLADQHCVATPGSARRVAQLGEPAARIHHTGAPGLDRLVQAAPLSGDEFAAQFGVPLRRPLALVTYHPPTAVAPEAPVEQWARAVFRAAAQACGTVVVTDPGLDPGRDQVLAALHAELDGQPHVVHRAALGAAYPRVLASADVVVGNSSSGIVEAGALGVPVVDVGDRQAGRERGGNVVHAPEATPDRPGELRAALQRALDPAFRPGLAGGANPYGEGHAAARIVEVVRAAPAVPRRKPFVDLPAAAAREVAGEEER